MDNLIPDSQLDNAADIEARIQSIYRQRYAEAERSLANRKGVTLGGAHEKQKRKLIKFEARADALRARLKTF